MLTYLTDTETCGFHGVAITIQWAINDGPVNLHHIWKEPIIRTLRLIEDMVNNRVIFHNARYDWFHLSKIYNMFKQAAECFLNSTPLEAYTVDQWAEFEWESQFGPCLKPRACVDTLILASKSVDQSAIMASKPVWVRRVPVGLAEPLRFHLEERTKLPWILFAKRKRVDDDLWSISNCHDLEGNLDPSFKDLKLSFNPSQTLKHLAAYLCDHKVEHKFEDIAFAEMPAEEGFAPYVNLLSSSEREWLYDDKPTWPALLEQHIDHWFTDADAQYYAEDDITMLRLLYKHFGSPNEDEDSLVACQVASVRLRGFSVDLPGCRVQLERSMKIVGTAKLNTGSPKEVVGFVSQAMDSVEQFILADGCDQKVIDVIKKNHTLKELETCPCCEEADEDEEFDDILDLSDDRGITIIDGVCQRCEGHGHVGPTGECPHCTGSGLTEEIDEYGDQEKCKKCDGTGLSDDRKMPVVIRVEHIEMIRKHALRVKLFDKLLLAKRAYPDFNVIGTKSGRMSGAGGLNFQGIDHSDEVRCLFTLFDEGLILSAGDYSSQELAIAATTMNDQDLMRDMESGKSLHGLFGAELFDTSYEDIVNNKNDGRYNRAKSAVFLTLYGGTFETLARNCDVDVKQAEMAFNKMIQKYPMMGSTRKAMSERFSSIKQSAEGQMAFKAPAKPYVESVFGFRRYFHTEYKVQKMIWEVVKNMPPEWQKITIKVQRDRKNTNRLQTVCGAASSGLYGTCFSIQNGIVRAANNHVIQSTGRTLTVGMQAAVWGLQPQGIHPFVLTLMSIHDELAVVSEAQTVPLIEQEIEKKVSEQCKHVPLTSIEWFTGNKSWAEKGDGQNKKDIGWVASGA